MIPSYSKEHVFFPHIQVYNGQNSVLSYDSDISDLIQNDSHTSFDDFELDDQVVDDYLLFNDHDITAVMFDNELYKSLNLSALIINGPHDENLILKIYIINQDLQKINP